MNNGFSFFSLDLFEVKGLCSNSQGGNLASNYFHNCFQSQTLHSSWEFFSFSYFRLINSTCMWICRCKQISPNILHLWRAFLSELITNSKVNFIKKKWAKKKRRKVFQSIRLILFSTAAQWIKNNWLQTCFAQTWRNFLMQTLFFLTYLSSFSSEKNSWGLLFGENLLGDCQATSSSLIS